MSRVPSCSAAAAAAAILHPYCPGTSVSYLTAATPGGEERFEYFRKVVDVPNPSKTAGALDFAALRNPDAWIALITFLYLDFLDATGTLFTMARLINENVPSKCQETGASRGDDVISQV
jgi:AGZA family xanthine/uracil permease-like MFS transporter